MSFCLGDAGAASGGGLGRGASSLDLASGSGGLARRPRATGTLRVDVTSVSLTQNFESTLVAVVGRRPSWFHAQLRGFNLGSASGVIVVSASGVIVVSATRDAVVGVA